LRHALLKLELRATQKSKLKLELRTAIQKSKLKLELRTAIGE